MIRAGLNKLIDYLLQVIFPNSKQEDIIDRLHGRFPLHISSHTISCSKSSRKYKVTSLSDYSNYKTSTLVHSLKYARNSKSVDILSGTLGDYLLELISNCKIVYPGGTLLIIPMPLSKKRRQERGFNQIELLLDGIKIRHKDLVPFIKYKVLIKHRHTKSQTKLSRKDRLVNVLNSFKVSDVGIVKKKNVILIDDVLTTGSTAIEASNTLIEAGANQVDIITIA